MSSLSTETDLARYDETLRRHSDWVAAHQDSKGVFDGGKLSSLVYMPYPLYGHATGRFEVADRACRNLEEGYVRHGQLIQPDATREMMPYMPAWLVMGAALTENVSLRSVMEKHLLTFQDRKTGGFFASAAARASGRGVIDFDSTTQACAALCIAGNESAATKCGQYLRKFLQAQPDPTRRLFLQMDSEKGLVREFDPKQTFAHVLVYAEPKAHLYKIGLLARAFAFLHPLTGDKSYLELAESHYRRAADLSPDIWTNTLAHKMGWAAWTLFRMTGRPSYIEDARRMADHLVTLQQPDGGFSYPELFATYDESPMDFRLNIGTQFALWILYARAMAASC